MKIKVAFRVDAATFIGLGHLMRCLTLAESLRDHDVNCFFITRTKSSNFLELIINRGFQVIKFPELGSSNAEVLLNNSEHERWISVGWEKDALETCEAIKDLKIDWVIVDHYGLDAKWESIVKAYCKLIMVIDDLADREHNCDLLLDPGVEADLEEKYKLLIKSECVRLIGPRYAILRPEFDEIKKYKIFKADIKNPKNLVVMFGGDDGNMLTLKTLKIINELAPHAVKVKVIISPTNLNKELIVDYCKNLPNFETHIFSSELSSIFSDADLAIGSGGGATYERLYMLLPSILTAVAENQKRPLAYMESIGLIKLFSNESELRNILKNTLRFGISRPPSIVSNGVPIISSLIINKLITLRQPKKEDIDNTLIWFQNKELRNKFLMKKKPIKNTHYPYWSGLMSDSKQRVFAIYYKNEHVGNAGLKNINVDSEVCEIWIYMGKEVYQGHGFGGIALNLLEIIAFKENNCAKITLNVSLDNQPAYKFYIANGYKISKGDSNTQKFYTCDRVVFMEKNL